MRHPVTIEAWGAQGGNGMAGGTGGLGAHIRGSFTGLSSQTLRVLVGGKGLDGTNGSNQAGASGGGETFVVDASSAPLVVAGGGGGAMGRESGGSCTGCLVPGGPGQVGIDGQAGATNGGAGGINGGGGTTWPWTGWHSGTRRGRLHRRRQCSVHGSSSFGTPNGPGLAFANGGAGGVAGSNAGSAPLAAAGSNAGHGRVVISW